MKGRRKQRGRHAIEKEEDQANSHDIFKRTIGAKPFQLAKVRTHKRISFELNGQVNSQSKHQRTSTGPEESPESRDVYLDLIIKKKMIIDTQPTQILQSQRKNLIYQQVRKQFHNLDRIDEQSPAVITITNTACHAKLQEIPYQDEPQIEKNRRKKKCQCCHHFNCYLTQAIIGKKKLNKSEPNQSLEGSIRLEIDNVTEQKQNLDLKLQLKKVKQSVQKSPFSFTNLKWRTKSEILKVDKWKEKYGRAQENSIKREGIAKIIEEKISKTKVDDKLLVFKNKGRKQKIRNQSQNALPQINRNHEAHLSARTAEEVIKTFNKQVGETAQSDLPVPLFPNQTYRPFHTENYELQSVTVAHPHSPRIYAPPKGKQTKSMEAVEKPNRKNLASEEPKLNIKHQKQTVTSQERPKEQACGEKQEVTRKKKKQYKFPLIQGSGLGSLIRPNQEEKKKPRQFATSRIEPHTWREKIPRRAFLSKVMEEIPERWEYGESRENSRDVDLYLQIKQEEEIKQICRREEEYRRQMQIQEALLQEELLRKSEDLRIENEFIASQPV